MISNESRNRNLGFRSAMEKWVIRVLCKQYKVYLPRIRKMHPVWVITRSITKSRDDNEICYASSSDWMNEFVEQKIARLASFKIGYLLSSPRLVDNLFLSDDATGIFFPPYLKLNLLQNRNQSRHIFQLFPTNIRILNFRFCQKEANKRNTLKLKDIYYFNK